MSEMLHTVIQWIVDVVSQLGYPGIVILMFLESSFFPFPSEVVIIPAGYLASQGEMNMFIVIAMGILGSWLGALLNYYLAVYLGRPFLLRWGKYFFLTEDKFLKVEGFFRRHGEISTFTGRLITVVRQYISFPAGLARMNIGRFLFYTGLGAGIWVTILAYIGYIAGKNEELIKQYSHQATFGVLVFCGILISGYVFFQWRKTKKRARPQDAPEDQQKK